jgi:TonB-linked SusC/RagA family outer membrane protein
MKHLFFFFAFVCLVFTDIKAQEITITGTVLDEKQETFPGVKVVVENTTIGVVTDVNGKYSVTTEKNEELVLRYSYLGYVTQEVLVAERSELNITMKTESQIFDEIVVVGYGSSRNKELTGAAAKVKGENIEKLNLSRMDQALQGQVSGVAINTNSGSPGGSSSIRIRGLSTFGDNDPLILVDGVVYDSDGLNALNPNDIESINVLKDATAGIYGVRAANGVIIVETKKGKLNAKPKIEFSMYKGVQQTANKLGLLNAEEYAVIKNEMFAFGGQAMPFTNTAIGEGTNWQDSIFQTAPVESYNIGISGGTKNTRYSLGATYFAQEGVVGGSKANFSRYNARLNLSTDLSEKLMLNSVFLFSSDNRSTLSENGIGSVLYNTVNAFPNEPIRTPDGNYSYLEEVADIINPIAQMENSYNYSIADKFVGKEELVYKFNEHLSFTNRFNYNYAVVEAKSFTPLAWYGPGKFANSALNADLESPQVEIADSVFVDRGASVYEQRSSFSDLTFESYFNYDRTFSEVHKVKATLGASVFQRKGAALNGTAFNIPNNSWEYADISANTAAGGYLNNVGSFEFKERLVSAFLRTEYAYDSRYIVSGILRRDGSSKFGPNNRYGWFPTLSSAWLISEESFFNVDAINFMKLRLSYGVSGNDQIENFAYRALLNGEGVYVFDDLIVIGTALGRAANPDLKWETTRQFNAGLDLTLWSALDFTTNYFIKNTNDLLFQPDVSGVLGSYGPGGSSPIINAGNVSNKGVEVELAYHNKLSRAFKTNINLNFSHITNKVTSVPEGVDYLPGAQFSVGGDVATRFEEGFAIGYFHGLQTAGIFQTQEEVDNHAVVQEGARPGDFIFVDQNGDGEISFGDDLDKTFLGSPIPDFTMGFALNLRYKGIDLSANIYASIGQEIIRNYERQQPYANQLDYVINRWTGPGSTNEHPRLTTGATRNNSFSDYYVEDGSFVRLRNVQMGYTFPKSSKILKKLKVESRRFYLSGNNLLNQNKNLGFDPDIGGGTLSAGVDYGFYPQAKTIMGGLNIKF